MKRRRGNALPVILLGAGLAVIALFVIGGFLLLGNSDGDGDVSGAVREKTPSVSTSGTVGGVDAISRLLATQASLTIDELPDNYEVDVSNTFAMTVSTFSSSYWFKTDAEGQEKAREWGVVDGYQVYYQPKGLAAEAVRGFPYIHIETYQFANLDGARKAWAHLDGLLSRTTGSDRVQAKPLANDSSAYRFIEGTIATTDTVAVYHRYSFRRGNTLVTVTTWGGEAHMNIDPARNIAAGIDDKLLGSRPAVEPTPIPTPNFPGLGTR